MHRWLPYALMTLLLLSAGGVWWWAQRSTPAPPAAATAAHDETTDSAAAAAAPMSSTPSAADAPAPRRSVAADATSHPDRAPGATLRVTARWPDQAPAHDVVLSLRGTSAAQAWAVLAQATTDADGRASFRDVPDGRWTLRSDRGDEQEVVMAGADQDIVLELRGGVHVVGTVVSAASRPVAGASVWLQTRGTDWSSGRVVTATDGDGRFDLEHVPSSLSLGAFAAGHAPSALVDLDTVDTQASPVVVALTLGGAAGRLAGIVVDDTGAKIAEAQIAIGKQARFLDQRGDHVVEQWSPRTTRSDAEGRFVCEGVAPGPLPIAVRAAGYGAWRDRAEIVAGETTEVTVTLARCATIRGVVTAGDGAPLAKALLRCFDRPPGTDFIGMGQIDWDETFGALAAESDAGGGFVIDGVTPGTAHVFAQPGDAVKRGVAVPYATAALAVAPAEVVEWNPVVSEGRTVEGIVSYRDRKPMPEVFVTLTNERDGRRQVQTNGRDGVFRFVCLDDSIYSVRVQYWDAPQGTPALERAGIVPGPRRIELVAPYDKPVTRSKATVVGRIDDAGHRITNPNDVRVRLMSDQRWFLDDGKVVDGAVRFEGIEPCRCQLVLMQGDTVLAQGGWADVPPGSIFDAGVLRTEPAGSLHVTLTGPEDTAAAEPTLFLRQAEAWSATQVEMGRDRERTVPNLTPGDYEVSGYTKGLVPLQGKVTIVAGATASLQLALQAGATCRFEAWVPADQQASRFHYTITRDGDEQPFHTEDGEFGSMPTRPFSFVKTLPIGRWSVEFTADDTWHASKTFAVASLDDVAVRLDLVAR